VRPVTERFWERVEITESCWLWRGARTGGGYGQLIIDGRRTYAHRWAYESLVGDIPVGLQLDHLCRTRHCVNISHLEPVTVRENVLRGEGVSARHARKTHCPSGHPYSSGNTYLSRGRRSCRQCHRDRYAVKVGKGYLFTDADIDEFIDARRSKPRLRVAGRRTS
jgi:hypothetical protein